MGGADFTQWARMFPLLLLALGIILAIWIQIDAPVSGQNGCAWGIIVLFTSVIGFGVYLFITRFQYATARKYKAVSRTQDEQIRKMYTGQTSQVPGSIKASVSEFESGGDRDFIDDRVEAMLDKGNYKGALSYIKDMIEVAGEMKDEKGLYTWKKYEVKVNKMARK